jgi:hypothetical protein
MRQRGIHNVFHSSYLRIHLPNNDCLFPGRLDNQVAEFDKEEREWAVDRILSHKGTRSDAVFKVRWKSGDITWLPYEQVDHLAALQEYFDILDVGGVSELIEGDGLPPTDNPQVFLGSLGLRMTYIDPLTDPRTSTPTSPLPSPPQQPMSSIPPSTPLFQAQDNGTFVMADRYRQGVSLSITLDQLRLYLQYDADLRSGAAPNSLTTPIGYDDFTVVLNSNAGAGIQVAIVQEGNEGVRITGRPPSLAELVGLEATRRAAPAPRDPREDAGGRWLDPRRSELVDHALWDNLECIKKQRAWRDKNVAERQAKRKRREDDEAMRPFAPSTSCSNAVAGPSNPRGSTATSTVPPPPPPMPPTPDPPAPTAGDEDEEMTDGNTEGRADRVWGKGKGMGRIPKK